MSRTPRSAPNIRWSAPNRTAERLVAVFMMGLALFMPPLLAVFSQGGSMAGIPLIYVYLFAAWIGLIAVLAMIVEQAAADIPPPGADAEEG